MSELFKRHMDSLREEVNSVDWEKLYNQIKVDAVYNKSKLQQLIYISLFIFDDLKDGEKQQRLVGFLKRISDSDDEPTMIELLHIVALLSKMHCSTKFGGNLYM